MASKKEKRSRRGSVSVSVRHDILRLRWTYASKPKQLSLQIADTPENRAIAEAKAYEIESDIIAGEYDSSLKKYQVVRHLEGPGRSLYTPQLFDQFTEFKRADSVSGQTVNAKYGALRSNLVRLGKAIATVEDAKEMVQLLRSRQSPKIANQNLFLLKAFGRWAVEHKHCRENLFETIRTHKGTSQKVQDRTPFSREELALFLETMRSHPTASHYYDFTVVLFSLGLRPSEAIGLRWRCINFGNRQITISESLSRAADGKSSGKSRQRKGAKPGTSRTLPLNDRLISLFQERWYLTADPDGLIFSAPGGGPIDDRNYRNRCWKECCKLAGIRYRPPYTSRHTMLTYGLEYEGWTERQAAAMAGHANTRMISETYGHLMNMPELPNLEPPAP